MYRPFRQLAALLLCVAPAATAAQGARGDGYLLEPPVASLTIHGGFAQPSASSELWSFSFSEFTMRGRDLAGLSGGLDLAIPVSRRLDLVLGVSRAWSNHRSEYRDWVDQNDLPIEQSTSLRRAPFGASLRFQFLPRGQQIGSFAWIPSRLTPWVGLGGGAMHYRLDQRGDFVDYETFDVFSGVAASEGWTPFAQASAGAGWALTPRLDLTTEVRYLRARAELGSEFVGFDRLDLSGVATLVGLTVRF